MSGVDSLAAVRGNLLKPGNAGRRQQPVDPRVDGWRGLDNVRSPPRQREAANLHRLFFCIFAGNSYIGTLIYIANSSYHADQVLNIVRSQEEASARYALGTTPALH
ncbi:hypothetical protein ABEW79_20305 [Delftia tsuruhatensis]|uniref:hypothetical protein n=1 Tax=Delftia tsuruhatensis TaxID=180282 RepID=UPI003D1B4CCC